MESSTRPDDRRVMQWRRVTRLLALTWAAGAVLVFTVYRGESYAGPGAGVGVLYLGLPAVAVSALFALAAAARPPGSLRGGAATSVAALVLVNLAGGGWVIPASMAMSGYFFLCVAFWIDTGQHARDSRKPRN